MTAAADRNLEVIARAQEIMRARNGLHITRADLNQAMAELNHRVPVAASRGDRG